ncbi:claudin-10 isoform X2 [Silurus meridionalis]|uniref:claudin-10 isoform X2 n=1 Tax=Silurus meridionalis TaxID=175797 RepID=UPI001EEBD366|nr:claudin-10 isoform X2 [Silurus meridionalis]
MNIMLIQVFGFLISTVGWFLVCCTTVMDYWRVSYIGGQGGSWVINAAWYWSTLWRECYTDSSDVANCRDYDTMWVVRPETRTDQRPLQAVRALLLVGMFVGFFAAIFCFIGMDCTYIGGHERKKCRLLLIGSVLHFTGGVSCFAAYCLYTARLGTVLFTQMADARILREMDISASRKYWTSKTYKAQRKSQTLYNSDNAASIQSMTSSQASSSQVSRSSLVLSDEDSFV